MDQAPNSMIHVWFWNTEVVTCKLTFFPNPPNPHSPPTFCDTTIIVSGISRVIGSLEQNWTILEPQWMWPRVLYKTEWTTCNTGFDWGCQRIKQNRYIYIRCDTTWYDLVRWDVGLMRYVVWRIRCNAKRYHSCGIRCYEKGCDAAQNAVSN